MTLNEMYAGSQPNFEVRNYVGRTFIVIMPPSAPMPWELPPGTAPGPWEDVNGTLYQVTPPSAAEYVSGGIYSYPMPPNLDLPVSLETPSGAGDTGGGGLGD